MSRIFDALQKSAGERLGAERRPMAATELIQAAEKNAAAVRAATKANKSPVHTEELLPSLMTLESRPAEASQEEPPVSSDARFADGSAAAELFSQFSSLVAALPPQGPLVSLTSKESLAAEKFRFLGVRLRQIQQSHRLKKVLITSTIPQEGKSVIAANLASVLARKAQQKTLLLEGDLRRPSLAQLFGLPRTPGMCECLQGDREWNASIYQIEGHNLWILPAGTTPKNPLELMQSGRLSGLMERLTRCFDWIIMDSPPVLPLADTSIWMRFADGILLVVRQGTTEKERLRRGLEAIESAKLLGSLVNSSTKTTDNHYYYSYSPDRGSRSAQDLQK